MKICQKHQKFKKLQWHIRCRADHTAGVGKLLSPWAAWNMRKSELAGLSQPEKN